MKMSFSFKLRSHSDKLLRDHLKNVGELAESITKSKCIENKELFSKIAYLIGASHDFGKGTTFFQKMLENGEKTKYANHGFLSSLFGYYATKDYLSKINKLKEFWYIPSIAWIVIHRHHGDIKNIGEEDGEISKLDNKGKTDCSKQVKDIIDNNLEELNKIYSELLSGSKTQEFVNIFDHPVDTENFFKEIRKDVFKISREEDIKYYFAILFLYSVLLDADKLDASETPAPERMDIPQGLIEDYKKTKFAGNSNEIKRARDEAYKEVNDSICNLDIRNERVLSINLPTGMGKTLTGLSFALNLRERIKNELGFTPRIIYSLPFLSIIDQNSEVIEDVLRSATKRADVPSNLFLKHHHLADVEYKEEKDSELINPIEDINKSLLLTEGWYSEIVITTFAQLFCSLITNKNRAARKFHNIVNSVIILDEIQSIPTEYWLLINKALSYLSKKFNCWIILMTATEPLIFEKNKEIKSLLNNKERYFKLFNRFEFNFNLAEKEIDAFSKEIFTKIIDEKDKNIMVVLNTIGSCKRMYDRIKNDLLIHYKNEMKVDKDGICVFPDLELINLSTHILPAFRLSRINRIKGDSKRKIIITTQLIEAGVDISVDIIYRDMAPLDCIIQSAGRCNRNNQKTGTVNVISLKDNKTQRRYCSYIYDSTLIDITQEIIPKSDQRVSEKEFVLEAQEKYYNLLNERKSLKKSKEILNHLERLNFGDIVEFRLIEEKADTVSIFVEIDKEAEDIRKQIEEILAENRFERKKSLLKIKSNINECTLSIRLSKEEMLHLPHIGKIEDFKYIPNKELEKWYKLDSGFQAPKTDTDMRIL